MLNIHLRRTGAKKDPHYRVVVADSSAARDGAFIEVLGHYHPRYEPAKVVLDLQRTKAWIEKGARPSDTVRSLLRKVEAGRVDVEESVAPSRQREAEKQAAARAETAAALPPPEEPAAEPEEAGVEAELAEEPAEATAAPEEDQGGEDAPAEPEGAEEAPAEPVPADDAGGADEGAGDEATAEEDGGEAAADEEEEEKE